MNEKAFKLVETLLPLYNELHPTEGRASWCTKMITENGKYLDNVENMSWDMMVGMIQKASSNSNPNRDKNKDALRVAFWGLVWLSSTDMEVDIL